MAKAVITLEDREDGDGMNFNIEITPEPNPNRPPTVAEATAFNIIHRLRQMESGLIDDDATDIDDPTDTWEPTE